MSQITKLVQAAWKNTGAHIYVNGLQHETTAYVSASVSQ